MSNKYSNFLSISSLLLQQTTDDLMFCVENFQIPRDFSAQCVKRRLRVKKILLIP